MKKPTLLVLAALAACAPMPPGTASPPPPPPMAMAATAELTPGVYTTTLAEADIPAGAPAELRTGLVGAWEIAIHGPTHAVVTYNGRQVVDAPFSLQGNQITFTQDSGDYACNATGRYTWAMTSAGLRFTMIEDPCQGRVAALTAHPWVKRP
ncbi:MAG TPA: hypothetical protein VFJ16_13935 [Longimicrobium sp.]|nr:hypothetical protein [Longimicrobium sp.]